MAQQRWGVVTMTRISRITIVRQRRAAAATELAVCLPLLVALCLVSVDLGRFAQAYIAVGNSARVAAERGATRAYLASTAATWEAEVRAAAEAEMTAEEGFDPTLVVIEIDVENDDHNLPRGTVRVTYPLRLVMDWPGIPRDIPLTRQVSIRRFR